MRLSGAATLRQYAGWFERRNLLRDWPGSANGKGDLFPMEQARVAARAMEYEFAGRTVIFVGKNVSAAFGFGDVAFLEWRTAQAGAGSGEVYRFAVLPHPSGVNTWYNVMANKVAAARFLGAAVRSLPT